MVFIYYPSRKTFTKQFKLPNKNYLLIKRCNCEEIDFHLLKKKINSVNYFDFILMK